jgi:hypothetical protein
LKEILACLPLAAIGFSEYFAELALKHPIEAADLLLFTQLLAIARQALTRLLAMLTWCI